MDIQLSQHRVLKKIISPSLDSFGAFVKHWLTLILKTYFWVLSSISLFYICSVTIFLSPFSFLFPPIYSLYFKLLGHIFLFKSYFRTFHVTRCALGCLSFVCVRQYILQTSHCPGKPSPLLGPIQGSNLWEGQGGVAEAQTSHSLDRRGPSHRLEPHTAKHMIPSGDSSGLTLHSRTPVFLTQPHDEVLTIEKHWSHIQSSNRFTALGNLGWVAWLMLTCTGIGKRNLPGL